MSARSPGRRPVRSHSIDDPRDPVGCEARRRPAPPAANAASIQALVARLLVAANLRSQRQRYAPPRHCPAGHERCARTGVCQRR